MKNSSSPSRKRIIIALTMLLAVSGFLTIWLTNQAPEQKIADATPVVKAKAHPENTTTERLTSEKVVESRTEEPPMTNHVASTVALAGCEAVMESKGTQTKLTGGDGLFDRVFIAEKTPLQITLTLPHLTVGKEILISAPNGGNLSRKDGPLSYKAKSKTEKITLDFEPSIGRGTYTIRIQHAGESQIIDLWAGARNPLGEPGPAYVQQNESVFTK